MRDLDKIEEEYGLLSNEELSYIKENSIINKMNKAMKEMMKDLLNIKNKQNNKYKMIEKIMHSFHKGYCPKCNNWLNRPDKGKFNTPFTCNSCKSEFFHHELIITYIWVIDDIINERIENLNIKN